MRHTRDTLLYILVCLLVSGSQRISLCFFVLQGLLILSLPSHTQGCCHCLHLTLQGFDIVALLLTPAPFPAQLHNSPPSAPSSRRETLLYGMNHHLAKLFGLCHSLAQISLYFSWGPIQVHLQTNYLFEFALQWHAIFLITHIISLLGKFSLANCPPVPLLMLWEQGLLALNKSKNSENEHLCPTVNSSAAPMQPLLLKNILLWHPWILLGYFKFESVSSQFGCHCWLAGTSIILWFSVVTRGGKVQFVWRKLKMNSGVQIQCMRQPPVRSIRYSVIKCQRNTAGG